MAKHRPHGSPWVPETSAHVDMAAPVQVVEPGAVGDRGGNATKSLRAFPNLSLITSDYRSARSAPDLVAAGKESFLLSSAGNPDARVS